MRRGTIAGAVSLVTGAALALPSVGLSAQPRAVQQGYGAVGAVNARIQPSAAKAGTLPFTGLDLGLVAVGGGGLLLLGGALKRTGERGRE